MKRKIITFIKNSEFLYSLYRIVFNLGLKIIAVFCPIQNNKVFFVSFNGLRFDDSPKAIYDMMIEAESFKNCDFVWAFRNGVDAILPKGRTVRFDSFKYYYEAMTSKVWVTNVIVERGLDFKRKNQFYVNTWHGTPIKILDQYKKIRGMKADIFCVQSSYDADIFKNHFELDENNILKSGLPRNDELKRYSERQIISIKNKLNIPLEKKVILYMPTYRREDLCVNSKPNVSKYINFDYLKRGLSNEYVLLVRMHYLIEKSLNLQEDNFLKSVTDYPKCNDLYAVADILVSDYSSAYFDFAMLERPMICFPYDLEDYKKNVGLYMPLDELNCKIVNTQEELIESIIQMDYDGACIQTRQFKKKYCNGQGQATEMVVQKILENSGMKTS